MKALFIDNWRNKAIALFFAVSIWFVAYQSENRTYVTNLNIELRPTDPSERVVVEVTEGQQEDPFDGKAEVTFSGPRKQIELLRERLRRNHVMRIAEGQEAFDFEERDFDFPRGGVSITEIEPPRVLVRQEKVEILDVDLKDRIIVEPMRPDYKVDKTIVKPESKSVRLRVPSSLKDKLSVDVRMQLPYGLERDDYTGLADLVVDARNRELVQRTVRIWDFDRQQWVPLADAPKLHVRIRRTERDEVLQKDAVKVTFQIPQMSHPVRVYLQDVPGDTVPVEFVGAAGQIELLRQRFREQPGFALVVPLAGPDFEKGGTFTLTENELQLLGQEFSDVKIRRHEKRPKEPWTYRVEVFPEAKATDAGSQK